MSPKKMIGLSFAAPAAKGYEVFDKPEAPIANAMGASFLCRRLAVCGSRRKLSCALRRVFDNILSNAAKYSAGDLTVTLTPDGAVTFANHAPNLSCVQANQLVDRFFTVETARTRPGGGAGWGAAGRDAGEAWVEAGVSVLRIFNSSR